MQIKELIIEGFKSYHGRTTISGWDPSFNAITGLNGSGKSNILDAICFVLGMTNVSSMRAQSLQDLIYKRGTAGVTKASVTIVFDNTDRTKSPVGFENMTEITIMRQVSLPNVNKYLLNGHKAQQQSIQTIFQSVQLNINNPHFLIMQGRITKVLNMRPQEILGMIEEAAGTRMFEERKDKARKTMGKKEKKVQEITALLEEEITPKLNRLRSEKRALVDFQKASAELERISKLLRSMEWVRALDSLAEVEQKMKADKKALDRMRKQKEQYEKEIELAEEDVKRVEAQRDRELKKGGKFTKLQEDVSNNEKTVVKIRTQSELKSSSVKEEEVAVAKLQDELKEAEAGLEAKRAEVAELEQQYAMVHDEHKQLEAALKNSEELLQTLLTGLSSSRKEQTGGGYLGQLAAARQREAQGAAEETQARQRLEMADKSLKDAQARWKTVEREAGEGKKKLQKMRAEVEDLRKKITQTGWSAEKEKESEEALRVARAEVRQLTEQRDMTKQRLSFLDFNYSDPTPNFDRSKVKGLVANLVSLDERNYDKATALEITAGARLYNVVVENDAVGKDLLENGRLKKRVTIIPLNKISARTLSDQKRQAAQRLTGDRARPALSLVGYADEVANAIAYVFGETLICDDADSAKAVTFSREVGVRSVTVQGDVYDPSGTLSGGAPPHSNKALIAVQELLDVERRLGAATDRLRGLEHDEARTKRNRDAWQQLSHALDLKEHETSLLQEQVEGSNASRAASDLESSKAAIEEGRAAVQAAIEKQKTAKEEIKKLEKDMAEFKNNKEGKIEQLKADVSKQKAALQKHSTALKLKQRDAQTAKLELDGMESDIESGSEQIAQAVAGLEKLKKELAKLDQQVEAAESAHQTSLRILQEEKATLTRFDDELRALGNAVKDKKQAITTANIDMEAADHELKQLELTKTAHENQMEKLKQQYDWIESEQQNFGKPGTQYDFEGQSLDGLRSRSRELEATHKSMRRKVNPKAANMLESVEKQESALHKNLTIVMKDKDKIEGTIEELDRYKREALESTWKAVNKQFGAIFAQLLPGNFAKLQPPEGQDLMDGLEVKVQLGQVWKQSLTELSGGQRSLIALSLIMSLLQFKPAPMYILDEIDAALDLSHTQHIGQLFRTQFKGSQFIVVSLKEGLFQNANVLFRTRFRDGTSIVERTAERSSSSLYDNQRR